MTTQHDHSTAANGGDTIRPEQVYVGDARFNIYIADDTVQFDVDGPDTAFGYDRNRKEYFWTIDEEYVAWLSRRRLRVDVLEAGKVFVAGRELADGKDGKDGKDGRDGKDGEDGKDGAPGKSVKGETGERGPRGWQGIGIMGEDGAKGEKGDPGTGFTVVAALPAMGDDGEPVYLTTDHHPYIYTDG